MLTAWGKVQYRSQAKVRAKEASLWEIYPSYAKRAVAEMMSQTVWQV